MTQRRRISLYIGDVVSSREPRILCTVLGSCIAACLRDPVTRVGGMNHFTLPTPSGPNAGEEMARFGVNAMERLIGEIQKLGGERERLEAKIFGGGHVMDLPLSGESVAQRNVVFIQEFLQSERIPVVARDLGGTQARQIMFYSDTGSVLLKRLGNSRGQVGRAVERAWQTQPPAPAPTTMDVTWFGD
ncbi:MAG TPA: chemotaxis protein CheD [Candidatus Acidoferrum sp.]|nr:chemotaxis protein CheD [Candidatus Acidoferrum sp.]